MNSSKYVSPQTSNTGRDSGTVADHTPDTLQTLHSGLDLLLTLLTPALGVLLALAGRELLTGPQVLDGQRSTSDRGSTGADPGPVGVPAWEALGTRQGPDFETLLGILACFAGLAIVAWWLGSAIAAMLSVLLQAAGRSTAAHRLSACAPAFMLRIASAVLGLSLGVATASTAQAATPLPEGGWSATPSPTREKPLPTATWTPRLAPPDTALLRNPNLRGSVADELHPGVNVRPGDSLWTVVARHLGTGASDAMIATAWPRWYEANRDAIGVDPGLIPAGILLTPPSDS